MISIAAGDILSSPCDGICIPVNCKGVMGAGLAKLAHQRWSRRCQGYFDACKADTLIPGGVITNMHAGERPPVLVFVATKDDWKKPSRISWIVRAGFELARMVEDGKLQSLAVPALGCGLGGLQWADVQAALYRTFRNCTGLIRLYPPDAHLL
jgi:O-acetyl-ADP-ribose deacetylase (regulator of RNase III)